MLGPARRPDRADYLPSCVGEMSDGVCRGMLLRRRVREDAGDALSAPEREQSLEGARGRVGGVPSSASRQCLRLQAHLRGLRLDGLWLPRVSGEAVHPNCALLLNLRLYLHACG